MTKVKKQNGKKKFTHPVQGKIVIIYKSDGKILDKVETRSNINPSLTEVKEIVIEDHFSNHQAYRPIKEVTRGSKVKKAVDKFKDKFNFNIGNSVI